MANNSAPRLEINISAITTDLKKGLADAKSELINFNSEVGRIKPDSLTALRTAINGLKNPLIQLVNLSRQLGQNMQNSGNANFNAALQQGRVDAQNYRTEIARLNRDLAQLRLTNAQNRTSTTALSGSYREAQQRLTALGRSIREAQGGFNSLDPAVRRNIEEYRRLNNQLTAFDRLLGNNQRNVGNYVGAFRGIGSQIAGSFAPALLAFRAFSGLASAIGSNIGISDVLADVQRTSGATKKEVNELAESLSNLPSRTPLKDLLDIAVIGGQLGIAKDEMLGFTQALDFLGVALAKEIPGGAAVIAESLGKINGVFRIASQEAVSSGVAMEKTGSAILALGQAGLATGGYIVDFSQRVGGSASIAKIALPSILAYGATLEEAGITAEVAGTAISKLIGELAKKRQDFFTVASIADASLTLEKFTNLINTDAEAALQKFFVGLNNGGTSLTAFYDILSSAGIKGERYTNAVLALANNQGRLNELTEIGTREFNKGSLAAEQAAVRNLNLAGVLSQVGNNVKEAFINPKISQSLADWIAKSVGLTSELELLNRDLLELTESVNSQDSKVNILIKRYDELTSNTKRTGEENTELSKIIKNIGEILPDAVTEWGKYGDALDINRGKVLDLSDSYKTLLKDMNLSNATKGLKEFEKIQDRISSNERKLLFARQEKKYQPTLNQANLVQEEDINPLVQAIAEDNAKLLNIAKMTQRTGNELSKAQRDILIAFGEDKASEAMYRYDSLKKNTALPSVFEVSQKDVIKNKQFWEDQVKSLTEVRDGLDSSKKGTKEWLELTKQLNSAQAQLKLYSDSPGSSKAIKQQNKDAKELQKVLDDITKSSLSGYEAKLFDIDKKYAEIRKKVSDPTLLAFAKETEQAEKFRVQLERINDTFKNMKPLGLLPSQITTNTKVTAPNELPGLAKATQRINANVFSNITDEFTKQFQSTFRRGLSNVFNDIITGITSVSDKTFEIENKYAELRRDASASQIDSLNKMERIEKRINNGITNILGSLGASFSKIGGSFLSSALSTGISSGDFTDLTKMFKGDNKAIGYGALGSLLGGVVQGSTSKKSGLAQGLGGALAGAGTGAAIGTVVGGPVGTIVGAIGGAIIGGISGLLSASKANKEYELQQLQLAEQRKLVALQERANALVYTSSIIGQQTNSGIVTSVDRNEFGDLVANIKGSDIQLVLDRNKSGRGN